MEGSDGSSCACVQITVLSIAALKKVNKGTRILLLDRNGGQAKSVAKELSKRGFKKVVISLYNFNLLQARHVRMCTCF